MNKYADVKIDEVIFYPHGAMKIQWSSDSLGFGEISIYKQDGRVEIDNEAMSHEFVKHLLCKVVDMAMPPHTSAEYVRRRGMEVFEDEEKLNRWMDSEIIALGGLKPNSLMNTDKGRDQVLTILGRIEHGVYS